MRTCPSIFEELPDVIKIVTLLELQNKKREPLRTSLVSKLDKICGRDICITPTEFDDAMVEMAAEGLVVVTPEGIVELTRQRTPPKRGVGEPLRRRRTVFQTITGLTDGSITGLVVILSSYLTNLDTSHTIFAYILHSLAWR